jgi:AAA+ superfamily predicted ATPase
MLKGMVDPKGRVPMSKRGESWFDRHPIAVTFILLVVSSIVAGVVASNLPQIGAAVTTSARSVLPWVTIISGIIGTVCLIYISIRILMTWPKRLPSGVLQVGSTQPLTPLRVLSVPEAKPQTRPADLALAELDAMVGLASVKEEINRLSARLQVERLRREQGLPVTAMSLHMVFYGPPGVGKTVVARALGSIYAAVGVLRRGHVVEVDREGLVAGYVGQTATKTMNVCKEALNGILFIDEAYSLASDSGSPYHDFGQEAISTILKFMEDNRDRVVVIVAGHPDKMHRFLESNPGLASRFSRRIEFPPYSDEELFEIFNRLAAQQQFALPSGCDALMRPWLESARHRENWGNARSVRTLLDRVHKAQAVRIAGDLTADLGQITTEDVVNAIDAMEAAS